MNIHILKTFISKLDFIFKRTGHIYNNDFEINILFIDNGTHKINGTVVIKNKNEESEVIPFETKPCQSEDVLTFESIYQIADKLLSEVDSFAIVNKEEKSYYTPKTKYLIHSVNGNINQAYEVNKKYTFEKGISENFIKINMNNKEIVNSINSNYKPKGK